MFSSPTPHHYSIAAYGNAHSEIESPTDTLYCLFLRCMPNRTPIAGGTPILECSLSLYSMRASALDGCKTNTPPHIDCLSHRNPYAVEGGVVCGRCTACRERDASRDVVARAAPAASPATMLLIGIDAFVAAGDADLRALLASLPAADLIGSREDAATRVAPTSLSPATPFGLRGCEKPLALSYAGCCRPSRAVAAVAAVAAGAAVVCTAGLRACGGPLRDPLRVLPPP